MKPAGVAQSGVSGRRGQSALEFCLMIPFVLLFLLAMLEIGNYLRVRHVLATTCQEAARRGMRRDLEPHQIYNMMLNDTPLLQDTDGVLLHYLVVTGEGPEYMQVYFDREEVDCEPEDAPCEDCMPPCCDRAEGNYCETCQSGGGFSSCLYGGIGSQGRHFSARLDIVGVLSTMPREQFMIVEIFHTYDPLAMPGALFESDLLQGLSDIYNYSLMLIEY